MTETRLIQFAIDQKTGFRDFQCVWGLNAWLGAGMMLPYQATADWQASHDRAPDPSRRLLRH